MKVNTLIMVAVLVITVIVFQYTYPRHYMNGVGITDKDAAIVSLFKREITYT